MPFSTGLPVPAPLQSRCTRLLAQLWNATKPAARSSPSDWDIVFQDFAGVTAYEATGDPVASNPDLRRDRNAVYKAAQKRAVTPAAVESMCQTGQTD